MTNGFLYQRYFSKDYDFISLLNIFNVIKVPVIFHLGFFSDLLITVQSHRGHYVLMLRLEQSAMHKDHWNHQ